MKCVDLPAKLFLNDFQGDYKIYIDAVFAVFERDFIKRKACFGSYPLGVKYHPCFQDRAYTFYHMTHKGEVESERIPDLRRCECMPWAHPTVEQTVNYKLRFWEQERCNRPRVCIWLEVEDDCDYFVILDVRKTFVLLWTAFVADHSHEVRKKQKEYEAWCKAVGYRNYTPDELIREIMGRMP